MFNLQVLDNLIKKIKWLSIGLKEIHLRLCTPFRKHNLKMKLLQMDRDDAAAGVRLPGGGAAGLTDGEKKRCCLLASGDSWSLLHRCESTRVRLHVRIQCSSRRSLFFV